MTAVAAEEVLTAMLLCCYCGFCSCFAGFASGFNIANVVPLMLFFDTAAAL
jgi:hypothetical protein